MDGEPFPQAIRRCHDFRRRDRARPHTVPLLLLADLLVKLPMAGRFVPGYLKPRGVHLQFGGSLRGMMRRHRLGPQRPDPCTVDGFQFDGCG